ncbi:MAG: hypothetical protein LUD14_07200 [Clostridiales bacterium]|nr:hypothetical protein [Clostridiales bacterium]
MKILLGFLVWYGTCLRLIRTFVAEYDFSGKEVYVFCTSGSSGPEKSRKTVAEICKDAKVRSAIRISDQSDDEIKEWLGIQK